MEVMIGVDPHKLSHTAVAIAGTEDEVAAKKVRATRNQVRTLFEEGHFITAYVDTPVEVCEQRDVKGMYKKAIAGQIKEFTGISDPYEEPVHPELILETDKETLEESTARVLAALKAGGYLE